MAGLASTLTPGEHAVLVMDQAGWHVANALTVPANITLLHLPPYSPELNPAENIWHYLQSHSPANRVYKDYDDLLRATDDAWLKLDPETFKNVCACPWIKRAIQG